MSLLTVPVIENLLFLDRHTFHGAILNDSQKMVAKIQADYVEGGMTN